MSQSNPEFPDEFAALTAGLQEEIGQSVCYDNDGGYYKVDVHYDLDWILQEYTDHLAALAAMDPGGETRPDEYEYMLYAMNRASAQRFVDMGPGVTLASASDVMIVYPDEQEGVPRFLRLDATYKIVGTFTTLSIVPTPDIAMEASLGREGNYTEHIALTLQNPRIETEDGEPQSLHVEQAFIPITDPGVRFEKRMYQEGN